LKNKKFNILRVKEMRKISERFQVSEKEKYNTFFDQQSRVRGKVNSVKLSICIPYKQRLDNIQIVFESLARQTMNINDFEVIVGAMEYCEDFISLCKRYLGKINLISILSPDEFSIPHSRNLAMRQATGQVVVQMDADTLLPPNVLQNLYQSYFSFGQNICIVGQVVGYGNNNDGLVESVQVQPYENYKQAIVELENSTGNPKDPRFQVYHAIPWAFGWTGFIALPLNTIRKNDLYFDETFQGWGVDDLEWSYRISRSGTPIILREDVRAIHLPHARDPESNRDTETKNYRRFLQKWPFPDVELAHAFGDVKANSLYIDFMSERSRVFEEIEGLLGSLLGSIDGKVVLCVGVALNEKLEVINPEISTLFDEHTTIEILPLIGMALPFQDKEIDETRVFSPISRFCQKYITAVNKEVNRVSKKTILQTESHKNFNKNRAV
jgi:glycosyltransferase involved in cell wall biosynthesis